MLLGQKDSLFEADYNMSGSSLENSPLFCNVKCHINGPGPASLLLAAPILTKSVSAPPPVPNSVQAPPVPDTPASENEVIKEITNDALSPTTIDKSKKSGADGNKNDPAKATVSPHFPVCCIVGEP
ncbi:hypothetical protein V5O48_017806 [Marasmius crinis-equi]|uniref:Uncharacterized protein n=1 Tax=Marasmius crinis-equi TaxID=585013 RepID=A0ABR3EN15_9AGAR